MGQSITVHTAKFDIVADMSRVHLPGVIRALVDAYPTSAGEGSKIGRLMRSPRASGLWYAVDESADLYGRVLTDASGGTRYFPTAEDALAALVDQYCPHIHTEEVGMLGCGYGCKVVRCDACHVDLSSHRRIYGCPIGR